MTAHLWHKNFLRNKKGYSGIIATIFMVLVVLFLIFNVQMFMVSRDAALQDTIGQSQQLSADSNAEQLTIPTYDITAAGNQATVTCQLKNTGPIPIELVTIWVQGSPTAYGNAPISIALSPGETTNLAKSVPLTGTASADSSSFWFVSARGNMLSPTPKGTQGPPGETGPAGPQGATGTQGPAGTSGLISSIKMNWLEFGFYDFGSTAPVDGTPLPAKQMGCDIPQNHYVMIAAEFTNMDPDARTISLTPDTYVWAVNPRDNTGGGALKTLLAWPIVLVQDNHIRNSFAAQDLNVDVPTTVYFFDWLNPTPESTDSPIPLSINLYGITETGSYGQNVPFVSILFTHPMTQVYFAVNPIGAGTTVPSGSNSYAMDSDFSISAQSNSGYKFVSWSSNATDLMIHNPSKASTLVTAGASGTLTANFVPTTPP